MIAGAVGRAQKDVIAKAKEMQDRKQSAVETKRKEEEERRLQRERMAKEV